MSFRLFCEQATDRQLANIIRAEKKNNHPDDLNTAERVALSRGFTEERIAKSRINVYPGDN